MLGQMGPMDGEESIDAVLRPEVTYTFNDVQSQPSQQAQPAVLHIEDPWDSFGEAPIGGHQIREGDYRIEDVLGQAYDNNQLQEFMSHWRELISRKEDDEQRMKEEELRLKEEESKRIKLNESRPFFNFERNRF